MYKRCLTVGVWTALSICAIAVAQTRSASAPADRKWEVNKGTGFAVAVPKEWRDLGINVGRMVMYRQGDGIGVPIVDETGAPLQAGMTVEKFPGTKDTLQAGIDALVKSAKGQPTLELVGKETIEKVKLADGTDGMILITEFIKEKSRRSLQMKLMAKDKDENGWVISAFLVGDKDSKWPTKDSVLGVWLRAHVESFVLDDKKLDEAKVQAAYEKRGKGP